MMSKNTQILHLAIKWAFFGPSLLATFSCERIDLFDFKCVGWVRVMQGFNT